MPQFSSNSEEFLSELESYLSRGPVNQGLQLKEIPDRLSKLVSDDEVETAEKAVQLLGTAVGQQSQTSQQF